MNHTLKYLSIQHELGMAVGSALRLKPMLTAFSRVCMRRLGLCSVHFHFLANAGGEPVLAAEAAGSALQHCLSVPPNSAAALGNSPDPAQVRHAGCVHRQTQNGTRLTHSYTFALGEFGLITLRRNGSVLERPIIELLKPLIARLTLSCQASIEHENVLQAVAARRKAEEMILFQLRHDDLTQLPNRRQLMERLATEVDHAERIEQCGALLFLDLDRFKMVNDTLGHVVGDLLLVAVAERLQQLVGNQGIVARLSGDEFVILLTHLDRDRERATARVKSLLDQIHEGFDRTLLAGEHRLYVTVATGIVLFPDAGCAAEQILRRADTAMYQAKLIGLGSAVFYDSQLSAGLELRRQIEKELQLALKDPDQFELHYQTQHNLAGECIGAEALIRWHSPHRANPAPNVFIPIAEETGLMHELGRLVIRRACADIATLHASRLPSSFRRVWINVSAVQFNHPDFVETLFAEIAAAGIEAKLVALELTETTLVRNSQAAAAKMAVLRTRGIEVAVDDFGTGYSSLAYLSRLPVALIKIDQTFVRAIDVDPGNRAIVETIVALGRALRIELIAEGVETPSERASLEALGCLNYQGFLFSRPMPLAAAIERIHARHATA